MSTYVRGSLPRERALQLLTAQDTAIRSFAEAWPAPRWIKLWNDGEPHAVMAWLNGSYARWYDIEARDYIGQPDSAVWPPEVCERFRELDLEAIGKAGEIVLGREPTPRGRFGYCIARKFATRALDRDAWAIYGEVCPLDLPFCDTCEKNNANP